MKNKKDSEMLAEDKESGSWIMGHYDDTEKYFEFYDIYFGDNFTSVSLPSEEFSKIVDLFRTIIDNEEKPKIEVQFEGFLTGKPPVSLVKRTKLNKKDFAELPTKWMSFSHKKNKELFFMLKVGKLKDGRVYVGVLSGKMKGKLTYTEEVELKNSIGELATSFAEGVRSNVIVAMPPEEWMMEDIPQNWRDGLLMKEQESKDKMNYIG